MPYLTVYTNVNFADGPKLAEAASMLAAETLHKPVAYVVANFVYNPAMAFGGKSATPGALAELKAIGLGGKGEFIAALSSFLAERLNIADSGNINIALTDYPASQIAAGGRAFG